MLNWIIPLADEQLQHDFENLILTKVDKKESLFFILYDKCNAARSPDSLSSADCWKQNSYFSIILPLLKHIIFNQLDLVFLALSSREFSYRKLCYSHLIALPELVLKIHHPSAPRIFYPAFVVLCIFFLFQISLSFIQEITSPGLQRTYGSCFSISISQETAMTRLQLIRLLISNVNAFVSALLCCVALAITLMLQSISLIIFSSRLKQTLYIFLN